MSKDHSFYFRLESVLWLRMSDPHSWDLETIMLWSPSGSFTSELGSVTNGIVWFPCQMAIRNYWISLYLPLLKTLIRSKDIAVLITVSKFNTPYSCTEEHGRKEMFYLTMHSTHFIYGYLTSDICQTTIQIVKEEGNLLLPHRLLFLISRKGSFISTIPYTG